MRGKRRSITRPRHTERLIPAHAGKTLNAIATGKSPRAHPRACGENAGHTAMALQLAGSSPRMRGKLHGIGAPMMEARLIPAHAGKTGKIDAFSDSPTAHPRACGENTSPQRCRVFDQGSSPRMRGKRLTGGESVGSTGLIPAHAGKTGVHGTDCVCTGAHPRACGENHLLPTRAA